MPFFPSFLKSVQPKTFSFGSALTKDTTITAVDLNNSVILFLGMQGTDFSGFVAGSQWCYTDFLNSTTIRGHRGDNNAGSATLNASVIVLEFYGGFLRQHVKFVNLSGAHGLTLGPKAFLIYSGWSSNLFPSTSSDQGNVNAYVTLDATNVNISAGATVNAFGAFIVDPH